MLLTTCRLSLSVRDSRISKRMRREPTVMGLSDTFRRGACIARARCKHRGEMLLLQRPLHLFDAIRLDHVADLDIVVAGNLEAALEAFAHFAHVFLEALERVEAGGAVGGWADDPGIADHTHLGRTLDRALGHEAAGNRADPANLECLTYHCAADVVDFLTRLELAFQGRAHVVGEVVDDVV